MRYNRKIIYVMVFICVLFIALAVYLTYFTLFEADDVIKNSYNRRTWEEEEFVLRGSMTDRNGVVLAESREDEDGGQVRVYNYGSRYTHVIGYSSRTYGRTGLELKYNDMLLQTDTIESISEAISGNNEKQKGASLRLTLDNELTERAETLMKGKNGAVVALVPKTGEVLCLYSNPTFDSNEESLSAAWGNLTEDEDSPFVARATNGLYAPGSTFKTVTAAAAVENGYEDYTMVDEGSCVIDGYKVSNYGGHSYGELDLAGGFAKSSNVMFATLAVMLGESKMKSMVSSFGIGAEIPFDIGVSKSQFNYDDGMSETDVAAVGIGQGKLMVTPMQMALVAAAVANDGVIMTPYLVEEATMSSGRSIYKAQTSVWKKAITAKTADTIKGYMIECVNSGTGTGAAMSSVQVAGKTGTAQNERDGKEHAWFICFAPAEDPEIAICVMQEYSGATGSTCAPIAKDIISQYFK